MAQQKGPEDQLAQVELLGHDCAELVDGHAQDASGGRGPGHQEDPLAGEQAELTEEFPRAVGDDHGLGRPALILDDLGATLEDDDQVVGLVAGGEKDVAGGDIGFAAVAAQELDLGVIENRRPARLEVGDVGDGGV